MILYFPNRTEGCSDTPTFLAYQTEYLKDLAKSAKYTHYQDNSDIFQELINIKFGEGEGKGAHHYKNSVSKSKFTGQMSVKPVRPFMECFEEDAEKWMSVYLK